MLTASAVDPAGRNFALVAVGSACVLLGLTVLGGWVFDVGAMKSLLPGWPAMKVNAALTSVLIGTSLLALTQRERAAIYARLSLGLPLAAFGIAATSGLQTLFGFDAGIDELLVSDPESHARALVPGRMSIVSAAELSIAAASLLAFRAEWRRTAQSISLGGLAVGAVQLIAFGYLGRSSSPMAPYAALAAPSSIAVTLLFATLATTTSRGVLPVFLAGDGSSARMIRRFGVPLVLGTWGIGLVTVTLEREGYSPEFFLTAHQLFASSLALGLLVAGARFLSRAEAGVRENELRFRTLVESSPDALLITDLSGAIVSANSECGAVFGCAPAALVGRNIEALLDPSSRAEHVRERARRLAAGFESRLWRQSVACAGVHGDGHRVLLELRFARIQLPNGDVILHTLRDVTEREHVTERTLHVGKMEAVGQLAGGIAHDYNNIVAVILSYASFLKQRLEGLPEAEHDVDEILKAAARAGLLSRQLLSFSPSNVLQPEMSTLSEAADASRELLAATLGDGIRLTLVDRSTPWRARIDRAHFEQILVNLARNARDAMPEGGSFTLLMENRKLTAEEVRGGSHLAPGEYVVLAVSDTGTGMSADTRSRAFEPFFTTKHRGQSAGLGLPMCYGVVKQLGGDIWVESEPEHGTTVRIFLPRSVETHGFSSGTRRIAAPPGTRTILVAEDDPAMRRAAARTLRSAGYCVLEASGLSTALELARTQLDRPIHLLLTDVVMPGGSGGELAQRMLDHYPDVKVLYMSGYAEDDIVRQRVLEQGVVLLQKPFSPDELVRTVAKELADDVELSATGTAP